MNETRHIITDHTVKMLESLVYCEVDGYNLSSEPCSPHCKYLGSRGRAFVRQLRRSKLFPISDLAARPLTETCTAMREFTGWEQSEVPIRSCGTNAACYNSFNSRTVQSVLGSLKETADTIEEIASRPCFMCVTEGCVWRGGKCGKGHKVWI